MKIKTFLYALSWVILAGACSDKETESNNGNNPEDTKSVYLKIQANNAGTKADEISFTGTKAQLLSAIVYFMDGNGVFYTIEEISQTSTISLSDLEDGVQFENIPSSVTQVYVVGNYNSSDESGNAPTFPTLPGQTITNIEAVELNIQEVAYPELSDGTTATTLLTVMTGRATMQVYGAGTASQWNGSNTPADGDMFADITLVPINSRIEIEQLTYTGTTMTEFTLEAIYINNFYATSNLPAEDLSSRAAPINNGSNADHYDPASTDFEYSDYSVLYDIIGLDIIIASGNTMEPDNGTWAYHVFGNSTPVPHIILKFTDVVSASGSLQDQYVTVTGFTTTTSAPIDTFEPNTIYKITNLSFDDDDLSLIPEPENIDIWVHVDVEPWTTVEVLPVI